MQDPLSFQAEDLRHKKFLQMTQAPIKGLVCRMAVPTMVSMMVSAFYNLVDTFYVGQISTSASAAVGIVFAIMAIIQAIGFCFGQGSGNYISRKLGQQDTPEAARMAATGFYSAFLVGAIFAVFGLMFCTLFVKMLGATATIQPYAEDYLFFILIGAPFMTASMVLNNQLRLQGNAMYAMVGISTGAVLNIALAPLLIFTFGMGISGAALATCICQFIGFCLLLAGCSRSGMPIRLRNFSLQLFRYVEIFKGGFPSLCRQGLAAVAVILLNHAAHPFDDAAVAAMSIVMRIMMFATAILLGFGQGFQPVCGFNFGAKRYDRVLEAFWFCQRTALVCLLFLSVTGLVFAPSIITVFRADPEVIAIGSRAMRLQCLTFPLVGWIIICNMLLQNIGEYVKASVLALARQGLFFVPMIWFLPGMYGLWGIQLSQPLADLLTFALSMIMGLRVLQSLKKM